MRRALSGRIEKLESVVPTPPPPRQLSKEEREHRDAKILRALRDAILGYSTWRHVGLSLEQLLAMARDDSVRAHANPRSTWSPGYLQAEPGVWVDFWPAYGAREFEIRILERDAKVDADTAQSLRKNLHAHFFAGGGPTSVYGEPLAPLPHPIEFDEAAALNAARLQCPHFDSLPLEKQLQYLEEDLLKNMQDAANRRHHAAALRASGGADRATAEADARVAEVRVLIFEQQIAKLKEKIAERDRSSGPSERETSATA